ncbi:MAG TPA: amidase family protein [Burkholderiales bacterium]|nr:amidase family protein [Burkholderiales bacterium]
MKVLSAVVLVVALCASGCAVRGPMPSFQLQEATVASIHEAFASGALTCTELVRLYLDRIEAFNLKGPALRAVLTVNPRAMETAAEMDRLYKQSGGKVGPLHCIPTILKDNFNTADMPTTGGNVSMRGSLPPSDAFTVARMRKAGALILAKANLQEFARGGMSVSSLGGQVLNPYDLTRTPGGSSGGTGVAIASNMAVVGTGSDTGQSIRSPASANNLVGIRPTRGLVSRAGVIPNSLTQDEIGPLARTVTDAALLLDVMAGYDRDDPITAFSIGRIPETYTQRLSKDALRGARIGVMTNMMGTAERHQEVNTVMEDVIAKVQSLGATIVRFDLPEYDKLAAVVATSQFEARTVMESYFAKLGPNAPIKNFSELVAAKTSAVQKTLETELAVVDGMNSQAYKDRTLNRDKLRLLVASTIAELKLDAILYPLQKILVAPVTAADQLERNGTLSNGTGFPAVTFPGGFSSPTASAPIGVPVGAEFLALDYTEPKLLAYAYAFEQAFKPRRAPLSTPPLSD